MKHIASIALFISSLLVPCFAQSVADLRERVGVCSATTLPAKKSACYEKLARDAIQILEAQAVVPAVAASPAEPIQPRSKYEVFIAEARAHLTKDFKDPSSVQWRNLFVSDNGLRVALCGELNGKNSYGAYVGFRRFVSSADLETVQIENPDSSSWFHAKWSKLCAVEAERVE